MFIDVAHFSRPY